MPIPPTTHLQFLVLSAILEGVDSGARLRERLAEFGIRKSAPAFYQLMARLEDAGTVSGRYELKQVSGYAIKERRYKLLAKGQRAIEATYNFYAQLTGTPLAGGLANG